MAGVPLWNLESELIRLLNLGDWAEQGGSQMPTLTIEYQDERHRVALEQAIAYVTELRRTAQDAPDGSVLDACEKLALADGRTLLRTTLAAALASRIAASEEKGGQPASAPKRTVGTQRDGTRVPS
jgi:hypothetical protein